MSQALDRSRVPWLAGGLFAILVAPPAAGIVLASVGAVHGSENFGYFFFIFVFATVEGFIWGGPIATLTGCFLGEWSSRMYRRGGAASRIRLSAIVGGAIVGLGYGVVLAMLDIARDIDLRWWLVPAAGVAGAIVGLVVTAAVLADLRSDEQRQRAS